ncbi:unnamed protein product [Calicophoron daubneyi]|uniref:Meiosis-specific nuclear structural protein 1 n=1 Tax=Calicophoron daubneyi TaxID=300641 RepID=A0AAV2SWK1_CALDB
MANGSLKDKIMEFRLMAPLNVLKDLEDGERRAAFDKQTLFHDLQRYRNEREQGGPGKYGSIRLSEQRIGECLLLKQLKEEAYVDISSKEKKVDNENLACELRRIEDEEEASVRNRLRLRNSEPELRDLAHRIRAKIQGQLLAAQIESNRNRKKKEIAREAELDKEVIEADRLAEEKALEQDRIKKERFKEEIKEMMKAEKSVRPGKLKAIEAEKEESKQLIQALVDAENKKIAEEQAERQRQKLEGIEDYRRFQQREVKSKYDKSEEQEIERICMEAQKMADCRRAEDEKRKRDKIEARKLVQEQVAQLTDRLRLEREKERQTYLDANEAISLARAQLEEQDMKEKEKIKKNKELTETRAALDEIAKIRKQMKEEEIEREREADRIRMEALAKEAKEREEKKRAEKERLTKEFKALVAINKKMREAEVCRTRRENEEFLKKQKIHEQLIQAERDAMIAEYKQYISPFEPCEPEDLRNKKENVRFEGKA